MSDDDNLDRMTEHQRAKFFFLMKVTLSMGLQHQSDERFALGLTKFAEFFEKHSLLSAQSKLFSRAVVISKVLV